MSRRKEFFWYVTFWSLDMQLVFDIGGTFTRCASISGGKIIQKEKWETPEEFEKGVVLCGEKGKLMLSGEFLEKIVVGFAGTFDQERKHIYRSPQLPLWNGGKIMDAFKDKFNCQPLVYNDAELAGLGEAVFGAGRENGIVAYITVGTGVGGARIVHGCIDEKRYGFEPGHHIISYKEEKKSLSDIVSGLALKRETGKKASDISEKYFWEEKSRAFAAGVVNVVFFWSPDVVVIGGSVGKEMKLDIVREEMKKYLCILPDIPDVVFSSLGDDSALWGGIALGKNEQKESRNK